MALQRRATKPSRYTEITAHEKLVFNSKFQAAAKGAGTSGPIKTPVKLSDEISIIPTKKGGEKKVNVIIQMSTWALYSVS